MAKFICDAAMDAALDYLNGADRLCICSAEPTTYTQAITTYMLAIKTISSQLTKADGDTSGRKATLAAQNGMSVTNSGTATYWALCKSGTSELLAYGTLTSQVLTAGNTVNFPALDVDEIADPT